MALEDLAGAAFELEKLLQPCFGPDGKLSNQSPPTH
jgi:hypothetical protein